MVLVSKIDQDVKTSHLSGWSRGLPLALPAVLLILAMVLPAFMFPADKSPAGGHGLGPAAWPNGILRGLVVFSAIWLALEIRGLWRRDHVPALRAPQEETNYSYPKALAGILLVILYGWCIHQVGFILTTAAFLAVWCRFGGIRSPLALVAVSLIGTYALLWMFMGLAHMPLPRGQGVFDGISIWLLQATGIY